APVPTPAPATGAGAAGKVGAAPPPDVAPGTQPFQPPMAPPEGLPGIPSAQPTAAPAPARPAPAPVTAPQGPDVIRRLLRSGNPQAIQYGLQLYRDMVRQRPKGGRFEFKTVGKQAFRFDPQTGEATQIAAAP